MSVSRSLSDLTDDGAPQPSANGRAGWNLVLALVLGLSLLGWAVMIVMVAEMLPSMDMARLGPGMGIFNNFGPFADMPEDVRSALTVLCLPTAASGALDGWSLVTWFGSFAMWAAMALAMMLPTAIPMLRRFHRQQGRVFATLLVMAGYLFVWLGYAVVATGAQWLFNTQIAVLSDVAASASLAFSASVLLAAAVYQFTPLKWACLQRCWVPVFDFSGQDGNFAQSFAEGYRQGLACLGCCAAVMSVMFVVGVMNVVWMALLGALMALEKTIVSNVFPKVVGAVLFLWGGFVVSLILTAA